MIIFKKYNIKEQTLNKPYYKNNSNNKMIKEIQIRYKIKKILSKNFFSKKIKKI